MVPVVRMTWQPKPVVVHEEGRVGGRSITDLF